VVHRGVRCCNGPVAEKCAAEYQPPISSCAPCSSARKAPPHQRQPPIVDLIENGLEAKEREKIAFLELADRLVHTSDRAEQKRLKEELARMTFGEP